MRTGVRVYRACACVCVQVCACKCEHACVIVPACVRTHAYASAHVRGVVSGDYGKQLHVARNLPPFLAENAIVERNLNPKLYKG